MNHEKTRMLFVGVGGQGVLLLSGIIGEALIKKGITALMSEIHGMAQRGGIVECTLVFGHQVFSPMIGSGQADIVVGMELMEVYRAQKYYSDKTVIIANTRRIVPPTVSTGMGKYPDNDMMIKEISGKTKKVYAFNASEIAINAGSEKAANAVMLGVLSGLNLIPLTQEEFLSAIEKNTPQKAVQINRKAFFDGVTWIIHEIRDGFVRG